MSNSLRRRNWWRIGIFAAIFLISGVLFLVFLLVGAAMSMMGGAGDPDAPPTAGSSGAWLPLAGAATTALTAVSSVVGLVMSVRRERRDSRMSDLEFERMKLDLEKANLEMEAMRKSER
jgi:hypothetical protein